MNETDNVLLDVKGLKKYFPLTGSGVFRKTVGYIKAVDDVTFKVRRGETVGVVGESGCGKTTLGRCVSRLYDLTDGQIALRYDGKQINVETLRREENHEFRRNVQVIFQDPYSSLNPRMTVLQMVGESLLVNGIARGKELEERVTDVILRVGLRVEHLLAQRLGELLVARGAALPPQLQRRAAPAHRVGPRAGRQPPVGCGG